MKLELESYEIDNYLNETETIDFSSLEIQRVARKLKDKCQNNIELIRATYEFVRDKIGHSADIKGSHVTCIASDVLFYKEGICYAKSHLLAALLRCNGIPTGFCYQKLILDDHKAPYLILHGLNGVYVAEFDKWIRLDPRGNKEGVLAEFSLDDEKLAFKVRPELFEEDLPIVYVEPRESVVVALNRYDTVEGLFENLPKEV